LSSGPRGEITQPGSSRSKRDVRMRASFVGFMEMLGIIEDGRWEMGDGR